METLGVLLLEDIAYAISDHNFGPTKTQQDKQFPLTTKQKLTQKLLMCYILYYRGMKENWHH